MSYNSLDKDLAGEYRRRLGDRACDIIAMGMGLQKYNRFKKEAMCPFHKEKTPSFKWDSNKLFWKCFGCAKTFDIYDYYQEFKGMSFIEAKREVANMVGGEVELTVHTPVRIFKKPEIDTEALTQKAIDYMALRKISKRTLDDWKVLQRKWNGKDCYVFQYFNDKEELEFVTYREIGKGGLKGGCEKDTKSILWGMWHIDTSKPVVITEGQPDAMAIWESGFYNVCSVPSGSNNFEWINHCWEWLENIDELVIFGDNDEAGLRMIEELCNRLGRHKVKVVSHPHKDANEVLYKEGKEEVKRLIDETISQTPKGILDMSKVTYVKTKDKKDDGIPTGIYQLDSVLDDLHLGELSILFGRNGDGKSTIISQITANSIDKKIPIFLYSGELSTNRLLHWLYRQVIGNDFTYLEKSVNKYNVIKRDITDKALEALRLWHEDLFFTYDKTVVNARRDTDGLFSVMTIAAKRYGCKLFIIDNLMSAMEENAESINADQSNFTQRCKDFAEAYNVHVILVAHPNKVKKVGEDLAKEDISGSNNIPNKADVIFSIERNYDEKKPYSVRMKLLKDREEGRTAIIDFMYNSDTKRLHEKDKRVADGLRPIEYNWKKYLEQREWFEQEELDLNDLPF